MQIFDFIKSDELSSLPEDREQAFLAVYKLASARVEDRIEFYQQQQHTDWGAIKIAQMAYVNFMRNAAERYEVALDQSQPVKPYGAFEDGDYVSFKIELDREAARIMLRSKTPADSIFINSRDRDRVFTHIEELRRAVAQSQINDSQKSRLQKLLDEFENELRAKGRASWIKLATIFYHLAAFPGVAFGSMQAVAAAQQAIVNLVEDARQDEIERMSPPVTVRLLEPPRTNLIAPPDDEIPF